MATNKGQYLVTGYLSGCKLEKREVTLAAESWEKFDELSKECVSVTHRTPESYITWVLEHYLYLCKHSENFDKGVLPDGIEIKEDNGSSTKKMTIAVKEGAAQSEGDTPPYIKTIDISKKEEMKSEN